MDALENLVEGIFENKVRADEINRKKIRLCRDIVLTIIKLCTRDTSNDIDEGWML